MSKRIDYIIDKLTELTVKQNEISSHIDRNTTSLEEHMKRTQLLEERFKPIEENAIFVRKLVKLAVAIITIAATAKAFF